MGKIERLLRGYLHVHVRRSRDTLQTTQEGMAALLRVSPRSYSDLEGGRGGFSAATLLIFLALLPDDREIVAIVRGFLKEVQEAEKEEAA